MRNPARPDALSAGEVQPGVTFLNYVAGELASHGKFTSTAQEDGTFYWIPIVDGIEMAEKLGSLALFGIQQAVIDGKTFWIINSYCVAC